MTTEPAVTPEEILNIGRKPEEPKPEPPPIQTVIVRDIDISFGSMVCLMVKFAFAMIPAIFIITTVSFICLAILGGIITQQVVAS